MLSELEIHHLGPIEKATIKPGTGMTVITGETGAGKSMLLSAINMITGDKVASTSITPGASNATAIGVFDYENETDTISTTASISNNANTASTNNTNPSTTAKSAKTNTTTNTTNSNPANTVSTNASNTSTDASNDDAIITSNANTIADTDNMSNSADNDKNKPEALIKAENAGIEIDNDEPELIMKRVIPVKGRGKCIINGETVVRSTMSNIGDSLITIHGQSDQLRISSPARQLAMLDTYADDNAELNAYTAAFNARMKTEHKLNTINDPESIDRADYLQNAIKRIKKADLHNGEYDKLKQQVKDMETSADRRNALMRALNALNGDGNDGDDGNNAVSALNTVIDCLDDADTDAGSNQVNEWVVSLNSMIESLDDMSNAIMSAIDGIESFDINAANQRLLEINHVIKRYGGSEAKALETLNKYENELDTLIIDPDEIAGLESELKKLKKVEDKAAAALTLKRKKAALELSKNVNNELHGLAMPNARMIINIDSKVPDSSGHDSVVFMLSAYKGAPLLPISKSASGGELSRIMLALELSLAVRHPDNNLTFVFDEVDANLGGTTGMEIGRRLARLAESSQVIIVSHLAQVAAYAGTQYVVSKNENTDNGSRTITSIHEVSGDDRIREIARMLSGEVSEISCEHARQLLDKCSHYDNQ